MAWQELQNVVSRCSTYGRDQHNERNEMLEQLARRHYDASYVVDDRDYEDDLRGSASQLLAQVFHAATIYPLLDDLLRIINGYAVRCRRHTEDAFFVLGVDAAALQLSVFHNTFEELGLLSVQSVTQDFIGFAANEILGYLPAETAAPFEIDDEMSIGDSAAVFEDYMKGVIVGADGHLKNYYEPFASANLHLQRIRAVTNLLLPQTIEIIASRIKEIRSNESPLK